MDTCIDLKTDTCEEVLKPKGLTSTHPQWNQYISICTTAQVKLCDTSGMHLTDCLDPDYEQFDDCAQYMSNFMSNQEAKEACKLLIHDSCDALFIQKGLSPGSSTWIQRMPLCIKARDILCNPTTTQTSQPTKSPIDCSNINSCTDHMVQVMSKQDAMDICLFLKDDSCDNMFLSHNISPGSATWQQRMPLCLTGKDRLCDPTQPATSIPTSDPISDCEWTNLSLENCIDGLVLQGVDRSFSVPICDQLKTDTCVKVLADKGGHSK